MKTLALLAVAYLVFGGGSAKASTPSTNSTPRGPAGTGDIDNTSADVRAGLGLAGALIRGVADIMGRKSGSVKETPEPEAPDYPEGE